MTIDAQVEVPGHGKWWFDRKTGSDKRYCQKCMHSIITPEVAASVKQMLSTKWIDRSGVLVAVSPMAECVCMLNNTTQIKGIPRKGMRASCKGNVLVERNDYKCYTMDDVPPISNYRIMFSKGEFTGISAYYKISTDPDLGLGYVALWTLVHCMWMQRM